MNIIVIAALTDIVQVLKLQQQKNINQTLRILLGTQFSRPTPEMGPLQAEF